jgi:hypothetical protein
MQFQRNDAIIQNMGHKNINESIIGNYSIPITCHNLYPGFVQNKIDWLCLFCESFVYKIFTHKSIFLHFYQIKSSIHNLSSRRNCYPLSKISKIFQKLQELVQTGETHHIHRYHTV